MENTTQIDDKLHWYKDAIIYELHIKAFKDGNGDGIGDFEGLISQLDYLQGLGITAIWLLPFYPSPLRDDGYDIADYYSINPSYGTIEQFQQLLKEAHKRNLKVITELVINHTSDQHAWFQQARSAPKDSPERNFYVWTDDPHQYRETRIIFQDFEASNWTWDPVAQQYYWHRFFHHQPDLNFDNSAVQAEIFKILDFWCNMGVDGFRLDAVPYLFERDGTNCENLPETHTFLKELRSHVDAKYPGTLLLAEANMWPEDSASYFGNGDECQMNYHFPIMPRMFMALQMEDRYPITDIIDQTPAIPDTCQWGIFLRNHDELTLEMVTDEERDYMYKMYVKDPKARINLGIRHRLAPLMDNDRRKIELLNYLLFSLPGTPIIYYGDEIGMGDNFYLGDRDGVRTPMQWSSDRNAGFSTANPQKLYLPVITDPLYHSDAVNVEVQTNNSSSLLWSMKKLIATRKKYKAFGRGDVHFIHAQNSKILSFVRTYEEETILVVVNLSRYAQPAEIDLALFEGYSMTEMFSYNSFPTVKADIPYFLTLSPYECLWLVMSKQDNLEQALQVSNITTDAWDSSGLEKVLGTLSNKILPAYLQKMRWFGGKAREVHSINIVNKAVVTAGDEQVIILLIEANYKSGLSDIYQLPVAYTTNTTGLAKEYPQSIICNAIINGASGVLYDAIYSDAYRQYIFTQMTEGNNVAISRKEQLHFSGNEQLAAYAKGNEQLRSRILSAEQSNSSIVYGNKFFLKIFRKVDSTINPDVEITRFLSEHTEFKHIPSFAGLVEWQSGKGSMVLAMMQELVPSTTDGWKYMLDRLDYFNEQVLANIKDLTHPEEEIGSLLEPAVIERVRQLGVRTGEMHLALASGKDQPAFKPEEFSLHYQRSLFSSFQSQVRKTYQTLTDNIDGLPDNLKKEAKEVLDMKEALLTRLKKIYSKKLDVFKIRIHGDYHLGQTLFTGKDIVLLDFEGEPAASYSERRLKRSALRDVAGMIRSFHYAAYGSLFLNKNRDEEQIKKLTPFVELWQRSMCEVFLQAYLETVEGSQLAPDNIEDMKLLLDTYILEKAVYELNYELNNRPEWVIIPIRGIKSIMS